MTLQGINASSNMTFKRADGTTYATFNTSSYNGTFDLYPSGSTTSTVSLQSQSNTVSKIPKLNTTLTDGTAMRLKVEQNNEINFASNGKIVYFGYNNRLGSAQLVDTYSFGNHTGLDGAASGNIQCGTIKIGSCKVQYDSTTKALEFKFV